MKILFDHQIFSTQVFGGISRYFAEIVRNLARNGQARRALAVAFSNNAYLPGIDAFKGASFLPRVRFKGKNRALYLLNGFASSGYLRSGRYDLFHPTYYDPYFLPLLKGKPFVLTIHDMIHEIYPEQFPANDPTSQRKRLLAEKATRLIAVSEFTKQDIMRFYGIPGDRIKVIYHGDALDAKAERTSYACPFPRYLLFVGKRQAYKNFSGMVSALTSVFREDPSLNLVFTGGDKLTTEEIRSLDVLGGGARWAWLKVSDAHLASLYQGAIALIFPSLYEGFGIPILEAFRSGCPVLLSRASCFPEIAGEAALYFDPESPADFEAKLRLMAGDAALRGVLAEKGRERAKAYSWRRAAEETFQVYREALGS